MDCRRVVYVTPADPAVCLCASRISLATAAKMACCVCHNSPGLDYCYIDPIVVTCSILEYDPVFHRGLYAVGSNSGHHYSRGWGSSWIVALYVSFDTGV